MKTALVVALALTLLYAVTAAPAEKKKASEQHSFHFYNTVEEQEGPSDWRKNVLEKAKNITKECGKKAFETAIECLQGGKKAKEQHSFHFYDKAVEQDEQLVRDLLRRAMLSKDATSAEMQVFCAIKDSILNFFRRCGGKIAESAGICVVKQLCGTGEEKKVEEQHSFHFYKKADEVEAQGENKKASEQHSFHFYNTAEEEADRDLINRNLESQDAAEVQGIVSYVKRKGSAIIKKCGPRVFNAILRCIRGGEKKAEEQHSFHFYDEAVEQDQQLVRDLLRSMLQSEEDMTSVEVQGLLSRLNEAKSLLATCKDPVLKTAKTCVVNSLFSAQAQAEDKKQDEDLLRDLISRVLQD